MCLGTLVSLFRVTAWSFSVLQTGIESVVDWEGKDLMCEDPMYLAAQYKAILTHIRGDWDFHASAFSLPKWNNVAHMCWLCHWHRGSRAFLWTLRQRCTLEVHSCDARELEV